MRTWSWFAAVALIVGCKGNPARDCAPYAYDPVLEVCTCPDGTRQGDGGGCFEYDGGAPPLDCPSGAVPVTVYADIDGDGHGNLSTVRMGCPGEPGTATVGDDCDDACADCYPGRAEVCDGADNDCAAGPDDTFACVQGTTSSCTTACGSTGTGTCTAECTAPTSCTPPTEACNELDDDCDGLVDEAVVAVGARVPWPDVTGFPHVTMLADGFVALFTRSGGGLFAQRFSAGATPIGTPAMISAGNVESLDAVLVSSGELVYTVEQGDTAVVGSVNPADLMPIVAPRTIGTHAGLGPVRIAHVGGILVLYAGNAGGIYARYMSSIATDNPAERTIVASRAGSYFAFDVATATAAIDRVYLAYEDTPAGETPGDAEIYVLATDGRGVPTGAAHRLTTNVLTDSSPRDQPGRTDRRGVAGRSRHDIRRR